MTREEAIRELELIYGWLVLQGLESETNRNETEKETNELKQLMEEKVEKAIHKIKTLEDTTTYDTHYRFFRITPKYGFCILTHKIDLDMENERYRMAILFEDKTISFVSHYYISSHNNYNPKVAAQKICEDVGYSIPQVFQILLRLQAIERWCQRILEKDKEKRTKKETQRSS